ncbi:PHP domain-containing protein [Methanobacterium petrolearium]|uniref:PHP domain-containing protein n=1 Tax=Methanobacterium petrolearium TaxID=710190 RepID=UPI001AE76CFE|nr:PHP domain-containing protein [Methanobacterium petrolearium]MBP1946419.1 putative metal-dependent phosphoesterase TrpH [Methanobacterium petrolearium]BDZ70553.1 histidinol-phosphatase [Methanobacterium petrolearium]
MKYDLHTHTKYSPDGFIEPKKIVKTAMRRGLSGIAITDHDTIKGSGKVKKYETDEFQVICGSEISTERGEVIGLFLSDEIKSHTFLEVVDQIKEQDGIVVLPHPFDNIRKNGVNLSKKEVKLVDCIEIYNSRCLRQKYNDDAWKFAKNNDLMYVAGSDAHFAREVGNAGIIIGEGSVRKSILKGNLDFFGKKSSLTNLIMTKMLKTWRDFSEDHSKLDE